MKRTFAINLTFELEVSEEIPQPTQSQLYHEVGKELQNIPEINVLQFTLFERTQYYSLPNSETINFC